MKLQAALDLARLATWEHDFALDRLIGSEGLYRLLGEEVGSSEAPTLQRFLTQVHPEDQPHVLQTWERALRLRDPEVENEHRLVRADGGLRWVYQRCRIQFSEDGLPVRAWGVVQDRTDAMRAVEREQELAERLHKIAALIPGMVYQFALHPDGRSSFPYASPGIAAVYGVSPEEVATDASAAFGVLHPDDLEQIRASIFASAEALSVWREEYRARLPDGRTLWLEGEATPEAKEDGSVVWHGYIRDITERREKEERLRQWANVFHHTHEGILITDAGGVIVDTNEAFTRITGYRREEVIGKRPSILSSGRQDAVFYAGMWEQLGRQGRWTGEIWNRRKNGEVYAELLTISAVQDDAGVVQRYIGLFTDITAQKQSEQDLRRIAHYDVLTGLPNRTLLADRLHVAMRRAARDGTHVAVVYLDLDGFKAVNDTWGHAAGDAVIVQVAERMRLSLSLTDTLARLGGDEFVAVLADLATTDACIPAVQRLLVAAAAPVRVDAIQVTVTASAGVTHFPQSDDPLEPDQLIRQADQAMYRAKQAGRDRFHVFDTAHDRQVRGHYQLLLRIRQALDDDEMELHYQPKVHLRTGQVVGVEALIRWRHPTQGLLPPARFLPLIQETPLSIELGDWVIGQALRQQRWWRTQGVDLPVSVNIDAHHLQAPTFVESVRQRLAEFGPCKAGDLEFEILETGAVRKVGDVREVMRACHELGVIFSVDDFGTGYSSLTYLKSLPAQVLKIDQSFVRGMLDDPDDLAILGGVLGMARAFRRQVIAEGVETVEHGEMLLLLGCELAQGYGIARPMPAGHVVDWLRTWTPYRAWLEAPAPTPRIAEWVRVMTEQRAWERAWRSFAAGDVAEPPLREVDESAVACWLAEEREMGQLDEALLDRIDQAHRAAYDAAVGLLNVGSPWVDDERELRTDRLGARNAVLLQALRASLGPMRAGGASAGG